MTDEEMFHFGGEHPTCQICGAKVGDIKIHRQWHGWHGTPIDHAAVKAAVLEIAKKDLEFFRKSSNAK